MDFWISEWISGFQIGFLDFTVDFWISQWISGFHSGFLDFSLDFWISGFQFGFLPTVYEISFVTDPSVNAATIVSSPDPTLSRGETFLAGRRARGGHETTLPLRHATNEIHNST